MTAGFLLPTNIQFEMNGDSAMGCFRRAISEMVPLNSNGQLMTHNMDYSQIEDIQIRNKSKNLPKLVVMLHAL